MPSKFFPKGVLKVPWERLGPSWGRLGRLGASWGVLGASWDRPGPSGKRPGTPWDPKRLSKTSPREIKKHWFSLCFSRFSCSRASLQSTWLKMASLAVLKPSWTHPGAILGRLARILGRLEAVLERPGAVLDLPRTSQNGLKIDRKSDRKSKPSWGTLGSEKPLKTNKKTRFYKPGVNKGTGSAFSEASRPHLGTRFDTMRLAVTRGIVFG